MMCCELKKARCIQLCTDSKCAVFYAPSGVSLKHRRAKYYSLTASGRRELEREATSWSRVVMAIDRVMQSA